MNSFSILKNHDNNDISYKNLQKKKQETERLLAKFNNKENLNLDQLKKIIKYKDLIKCKDKEDLEEINKELNNKIKSLREKLSAANKHINSSNIRNYEIQINDMKNKINDMNFIAEQKNNTISNIEKELKLINSKCISLIKENDYLTNKINKLENELQEVEEKQFDKLLLEMKIRKLEEKNKQKREKIAQLNKINKSLENKIRDDIWIKPTVQLYKIIKDIKRLSSNDTTLELCDNVEYITFPVELTQNFIRRNGAGYNPTDDFNPADWQ